MLDQIILQENFEKIQEWRKSNGQESPGFTLWPNVKGQFNYEDIYDFLTKHMLCKNAEGSYTLASHDEPLRIVEVGSYLGQSTSFLLECICHALHSGLSSRAVEVHVVDTFQGATDTEKGVAEASGGSFLETFQANLGPWCSELLINVNVGKSLDVVNKFNDETVDFVFIDADHAHEEVYKDIQAWYKKLRPEGSVIAGHDWQDPGVRSAYGKTFWRPPTLITNNSWLLVKQGDIDFDPRSPDMKYISEASERIIHVNNRPWLNVRG